MIDQSTWRQGFKQEIAVVLLCLISIKLFFLIIDTNPRFFMWDSITYLKGALGGELPRDRSFLYSFLIEVLAVPTRSLHALVIAQSMAGVASAFLVFVMLRRCLSIEYPYAMVAAGLIAIEPAQLFYERMVMAEAFGGVFWLGFIAAVLMYGRDGRARWLPVVALLGILAISFRLNGVLTAVVLGILLPLWRAFFSGDLFISSNRYRVFFHVLLMVLSTTVLHVGYRHIVGMVAHTPPGYIGTEGLFRLGFVAPLVEPQHFANTACPPDILQRVRLPLHDVANREGQLWHPDGLWSVMQRDCLQPERVADVVSQRAFAAHPLALVSMALATTAQYFDKADVQWRMNSDLGRNGASPGELTHLVREHFFLEAATLPWIDTPTSRMFEHSHAWLTACLFLSPILAVWLLWRERNPVLKADLSGFTLIVICLFFSQIFLCPIISFRYLHPFPPLFIIALTAIFARKNIYR